MILTLKYSFLSISKQTCFIVQSFYFIRIIRKYEQRLLILIPWGIEYQCWSLQQFLEASQKASITTMLLPSPLLCCLDLRFLNTMGHAFSILESSTKLPACVFILCPYEDKRCWPALHVQFWGGSPQCKFYLILRGKGPSINRYCQ